MGRPRQISSDEVLGRAMLVFWRRGYAATSIADLVAATGAKRSTLYRSFGSKAGLYRASVERYSELQRQAISLTQPPADQLRQWFDHAIRQAMGGDMPAGCLLINSTSEYATMDPELRVLVETHLGMVESWFRLCAQAIRPEADLQSLTAILVGANLSIFLMGRGGAPEASLRAVADHALSAITPSR